MDPKLVKEWKANYEALNRLTDEERRRATIQERYKAFVQIWQSSEEMGLMKPKPFDFEVAERWRRLREAYTKAHE